MRFGGRLKEELGLRGMRPANLCALLPDLDVRTLSAILARDSEYSTYAPSIAIALGLELHWLLTGEEPKERKSFSLKEATNEQLSAEILSRLNPPGGENVKDEPERSVVNGKK